MGLALIFLMATLVAASDAESENKPAADAGPAVRVIDPTYIPQVGDRAFVDTGRRDEEGDPYAVPANVSVEEFVIFLKLQVAHDEAAIDKLEQEKKLLLLDPGTEVLVTGLSRVEVDRVQLPQGIAARGTICAEIKVLTGEDKGKMLYTVVPQVVRYASAPPATGEPAAPPKAGKGKSRKKKAKATLRARSDGEKAAVAEKPANDATRAASLLTLGQNLEKAGKIAGALEFYRKVVKQFPLTPAAKIAEERIKALGKGS